MLIIIVVKGDSKDYWWHICNRLNLPEICSLDVHMYTLLSIMRYWDNLSELWFLQDFTLQTQLFMIFMAQRSLLSKMIYKENIIIKKVMSIIEPKPIALYNRPHWYLSPKSLIMKITWIEDMRNERHMYT